MPASQPAVALLVHTCDSYQFLYPGFSYFFEQNWDFNTRTACYFATEEIKVTLPHFKNIRSGKGEWADRLRYLLQTQITEPYVLYFQEDMWLNEPVSSAFFNRLFELAAIQQWQQVKLGSAAIYQTHPTDIYIEGFNVSLLDNQTSGYLMSHQVTLWDKEFLIQQLRKGEHPWRNERKGTKRLRKLNPAIFHIDYFAENGQPPINANQPQVVRSAYYTVSVNSMLAPGVAPFITALQQAGAEQQAYAEALQHHYQNQLTHNGSAKPRKDDIFKKAKRWLLRK